MVLKANLIKDDKGTRIVIDVSELSDEAQPELLRMLNNDLLDWEEVDRFVGRPSILDTKFGPSNVLKPPGALPPKPSRRKPR